MYTTGGGRSIKHLDIECDDEESYHLLTIGLKLLLGDVIVRNQSELDLESAAAASRKKRSLTVLASTWLSSMTLYRDEYCDDPAATLIDDGKRQSIVTGLQFLCSKLPSLTLNSNAHPPSSSSSSSSLPPAQFLGWKSAGTQIWARLKLAGLEVKCVFSWEMNKIILKIRCPNWRLEEVAERINLKLRRRDGQIKRFKISRREHFLPAGNDGCIFSSSERQRIIDFIIRSKIKDGGAELDVHTELGAYIVSRFPLHMHSTVHQLQHSWVRFWKQEAYGVPAKPW